MSLTRWPVLVFALGVAGCITPTRVGSFGPSEFYAIRDHYRVSYASESSTPMGTDWQLDNFQLGGAAIGPAKWTGDYTRSIALDENDDGRPERPVIVERYDLRFVHRVDGAVLWSQTTPIPSRSAERALDVIAHDFVDRVGGSSVVEVDWSADTVTARRYGTVIREEGPVTVDGIGGHWITFDVVSLDQREADASHQGERVTVVLVRPSARWTREARTFDADATDGWPMLVMFGYSSRAEHHDAHRPDLEDFLRRVDFHETP